MSSSQSHSKINFSGIEDPNDAGALAKALARIDVGKPQSSGGVLQHSTNADIVYESFDTHTPPDIPPNTRIIAVLGIEQARISPEDSGWFLSDFMAFWHILHGFTKHQSWYHCLDLDAVIQSHTRYLHGNPYKKRKVVFDATVLQEVKKPDSCFQKVSDVSLCSKFRSALKQECKAAEATGDNVLVLMFGHGDHTNHGIKLGDNSKTFQKSAFRYAMKGLQTRVTMITTQCYGGGWTCMPAINFSAMTAAGVNKPSRSWRYSGSSGRACGSMFTTAIIERLTLDPATGRSLMDYDGEEEGFDVPSKPPNEEQWESYTQLCSSVVESNLKNVDRRGFVHEMSFSAQDDAWSMCWRARTGIPLAEYKKRWDGLQEWEADATLHPGDPFNRDPNVTADQEAEYKRLEELSKAQGGVTRTLGPLEAQGTMSRKRKTSGLFGGTLGGLITAVKTLGADYLRSDPGNEDTADDGPLQAKIRWIIGNNKTDEEKVEWVWRSIQYRMEQQAAADRYLELMEIAPPLGQKCCEFDARPVPDKVPKDKYNALKKLISDRETVLFPRPTSFSAQGNPFYKGHRYLVAAFHLAQLSKGAMVDKLDTLVERLQYEIELQKEVVKRDPEVQAKRRKLYGSFNLGGQLSPRKRMSISTT
ncbi:MAG: hypothetical protein L6R39_000766 [Caloplaca ligustica]|nr:MAG: hypothetical protein L6R39_000766 [Caloplaca ligustica]